MGAVQCAEIDRYMYCTGKRDDGSLYVSPQTDDDDSYYYSSLSLQIYATTILIFSYFLKDPFKNLHY